ncbi:UNVERIFIED_CONTAM: hypothetical protein GTU68_011314, partial [Idotea baltica]|nr:hypothetical protein [Idotea baltica]
MTRPPRLTGKSVLATASGQGIGRAAALALAQEGAKVFATDKNADLLGDLDHPNIETFALDVLNDADVTAAAAKTKPDVLFNCAGFVHNNTILDCSDEDWDFAFNLNVRAMFKTMQAALPGMLERGGGSIVNMSSAASSIIGAPNRFVYGTTKAA